MLSASVHGTPASRYHRLAVRIGLCSLWLACTHPTAGGSGATGGQGAPSSGGSGGTNPSGGGAGPSGGVAGGNPGGTIARGGGALAGGATGGVVVGPGKGGQNVVSGVCASATYSDRFTVGYAPDAATVSAARTLANQLTLEEKADQMRGTGKGQWSDIFRTPDNNAKGIKGFLFRDGGRGVNLAAELPTGKKGYSTAFPVPIARGASFDLDLEYRVGQAIGDEMVAARYTMMLAPAVNVLRHPGWGRAQETYGEDPFHLGRLGSAFVVGVQEYVPACAKHYAANNIENGRAAKNAVMDGQTLRELYTRHFEMIVKEGGVACIMASYNLVNGKHATESSLLLNDVLRTEMGFKGFVLTDWWAMTNGQNDKAAPDQLQTAAKEGVAAGLDMELPWSLNYSQLGALVSNKALTESQLTTSVTRILEQKMRFKVDKLNTATAGLKTAKSSFNAGTHSIENNQANIDLAQEAAVKSMVLLKNDNNTLPIDRSKVKTVAVLGATVDYTYGDGANTFSGKVNFATDVRTGDMGSSRVYSDPARSTSPFQGIKNVAGSVNVVSGTDAASAASADFVVVVAGLTALDEGEEYTGAGDRSSFALDAKANDKNKQNALITAAAALKKPTVVVLIGGSVIDMPWLSQVPAVVMAWYPGQDGGNALGKLLFGDANFSGKLPLTWPASWDQEPPFSTGSATVNMEYYLGYRWFDNKNIKPLYPFGHGLSYTTFTYSNLKTPCPNAAQDAVVNVTVDVANTGSAAGEEVVFLFVSYPSVPANVRRPAKELKSFQKVALAKGATTTVTLPLRMTDLRRWDDGAKKWVMDPGQIQIQVGPNANTLPLTTNLTVN